MILCDLTTFSREVICSDNSLKVKVSSKNVTSRCEIKNKSLFFFFREFLLVLKKYQQTTNLIQQQMAMIFTELYFKTHNNQSELILSFDQYKIWPIEGDKGEQASGLLLTLVTSLKAEKYFQKAENISYIAIRYLLKTATGASKNNKNVLTDP